MDIDSCKRCGKALEKENMVLCGECHLEFAQWYKENRHRFKELSILKSWLKEVKERDQA